MKKTVLPLLGSFILILAACTPGAPAADVVQSTQAPTSQPVEVAAATEVPTLAPTAIPPTPTEAPPAEPSVFISSGVNLEDLAGKLPLGDLFDPNSSPFKEFTDKDIAQFGRELYATGLFIVLNEIDAVTVFAPEYVYEDIPIFPDVKDFLDAVRTHIVPGIYLQSDLLAMDGQSIPTMIEGKSLNVTVNDGVVYLNDSAMVIQGDILAANGVIHVIDNFLLPKSE